jgi:hypothetical protein
MGKPTAAADPELKALVDAINSEEFDLGDMTDDEFHELVMEIEDIAKPLPVDPYKSPAYSEERSVITPEEKAQLARNIQDMDETTFVNDNLTRAVARYAPRELEKYVIPKEFPGWKDATWQSTNQTRMGMHSRAKAALGQTDSPRGGQERPSGNGSITA